MRKRTLIIGMLFVLTLCCCISGYADEDKKSDLFFYRLKGNGTAVITGFDWKGNRENDIYVPEMIDGYTVTEIGEYAFSIQEQSDDAVIIDYLPNPSELYKLGEGKRKKDGTYGSDTRPRYEIYVEGYEVNVILPKTITAIRSKAFFSTKIKSINIPSSVSIIEGGAFSGCINLNQFSIDSENTFFATIDGILYNKKEKMLIAIPMGRFGKYPYHEKGCHPGYNILSIPEGIRSIGEYAFYGMGLAGIQGNYAGVIFPDSLEIIQPHAFENACIGSLNNQNISSEKENIYNDTVFNLNNVKRIGEYAFSGADFTSVNIEFPKVEEIHDHAFSYVSCGYQSSFNDGTMRSLVFPDTLNELGANAFRRFRPYPITKIDLSHTHLTALPDFVFYEIGYSGYDLDDDSKKAIILLPETLETIGRFAFSGAYQYGDLFVYKTWGKPKSFIITISIPASVKLIDDSAFTYTSLVISFSEQSKLKRIGDNAFCNTQIFNPDKKVVIPSSLEEIGTEAFYITRKDYLYSDAIKILSIPNSVKKIGESLCDRAVTSIEAEKDSYAAIYAEQNGISFIPIGGEDTSWLND